MKNWGLKVGFGFFVVCFLFSAYTLDTRVLTTEGTIQVINEGNCLYTTQYQNCRVEWFALTCDQVTIDQYCEELPAE